LAGENQKVIRRYSNFEALRNKLITKCPECIIPIVPPKRYSEKMVSDDSDEVKDRMRGFTRFLTKIAEHPTLSANKAFVDFLRNSEYATEASTPESTSLEEDTSTVKKYIYSWYETVRSKISGSDGTLTFKGKTTLDSEFNSDLTKLRNLLDFVTKLHENAKSLKDLMGKENENCRDINSVIGNLQTSIKELDTDAAFEVDDEISGLGNFEEEKKANFGDNHSKMETSKLLKESADMYQSETNNEKTTYNLITEMEEGIDILLSCIDSIERRIKYKRALEITKEDLGTLNNSSEENKREKMLKEERVKKLNLDIDKIDQNLRDEIAKSVTYLEGKVNSYIGKMVNVRKNHLGVQKEQWKKIALKYSSS